MNFLNAFVMKSDLLKSCRFYNGESESPFSDSRTAFWSLERSWVREASASPASILLADAIENFRVTFPDWVDDEPLPLSLKAFLLDRYCSKGGTPYRFRVWLEHNWLK